MPTTSRSEGYSPRPRGVRPGNPAFPGETSAGAAGRPRAGDVVGLAVTRPGRHRHAHRRQRPVAVRTELEVGARRDGQAGAGPQRYRLGPVPPAPPHLALAAEDVPQLVDGAVSHRPGN